jgi:hypothetical protein
MLFRQKPRSAAVPALKVIDSCDFRRISGGSGNNGQTTTTTDKRLSHTAGASAEV